MRLQVGAWLQGDVEGRLAAAAPLSQRASSLAETFYVVEGDAPDFFMRVVRVIAAVWVDDQYVFADALGACKTTPTWLPPLAQQRSVDGISWANLTCVQDVCRVREDGRGWEFTWELGIYRHRTWEPLPRWKFQVLMITLVMDACEVLVENEPAASKTACLQALAAHFNHAARAAAQSMRILMSGDGRGGWKLDMGSQKDATEHEAEGSKKRKQVTTMGT